jgi:ribosomal protein S4
LIAKRSEAIAKANRPAWLDYDAKALTGRVLSKPVSKDMETSFDVTPIIEYYSR